MSESWNKIVFIIGLMLVSDVSKDKLFSHKYAKKLDEFCKINSGFISFARFKLQRFFTLDVSNIPWSTQKDYKP